MGCVQEEPQPNGVPAMAHHLTLQERERLSLLRVQGASQAEIARQLGRHPSTISCELRRNRTTPEYSAVAAQGLAEARRRDRPLIRKINRPDISRYVRSHLTSYWSPEQIAGRLRRDYPHDCQWHISHQSIYAWIAGDAYRSHWRRYLRHGGQKRTRPEKRGQIADRVAVAGRPLAANRRRRFGDWEGDTVVSRQRRGGVLTLVERKSRFTLIRKVRDLKARTVRTAARRSLAALPQALRRTLTFDNGKEFAEHRRLAEQLTLAIYFARPYAAWQRGTNENTNGLLRQFHPKGTDFTTVRPAELQTTQDFLNHRPRKCLDYRTPTEVLQPYLHCV